MGLNVCVTRRYREADCSLTYKSARVRNWNAPTLACSVSGFDSHYSFAKKWFDKSLGKYLGYVPGNKEGLDPTVK